MHFIKTYSWYIVLPILVLLTARVFFRIDGLYGQDAYEYLRFTKSITEFWHGGVHPYDFFWPIVYPFIGSIFTFVFQDDALSLQLVSIFSLTGCLIYLSRVGANESPIRLIRHS